MTDDLILASLTIKRKIQMVFMFKFEKPENSDLFPVFWYNFIYPVYISIVLEASIHDKRGFRF